MMNVVLIGMKHCGKSTIGQGLARRWECRFYDVDSMLEATHACDRGTRLSAREILATCGEEYFARLEGHVVCELYLKLDRQDSQSVVALGGRTALNSSVCELLRAVGPIVYLDVPVSELFARVERNGLPPFLDPQDPARDFAELAARRGPQYKALADLTIELGGLSVAEAVERVAAGAEEHAYGRQ